MDRLTTIPLRIGDWRVDPQLCQIARGDHHERLDARTLRLLLYLANRAGETVSIEELLDNVWSGVVVTQDSVYQAVTQLRRLLGDDAVLNVGEAGAAHYAAMVQDSLLVACAQAQNEALQLLEAFPGEMSPRPVQARLRRDGAPGGRADWAAEDALRLQAVIPLLAQAAMQQMADALDAQQLYPPSPRLGPFVRPDDLG